MYGLLMGSHEDLIVMCCLLEQLRLHASKGHSLLAMVSALPWHGMASQQGSNDSYCSFFVLSMTCQVTAHCNVCDCRNLCH